jgi:uncharacterized cupredoxin-like copper-binding protein
MKPNRLYAALALVAVLAVAGCGSSNKSSNTSSSAPAAPATTSSTPTTSSGGGGSKLKLTADPSGAFKFNTTTLKGKAGNVTITMDNPSSVPHGVAIEGSGVSKVGSTVAQNGTSTVSAKLKPGKYTFYCPVPGHRQAGMQGTLTVQ